MFRLIKANSCSAVVFSGRWLLSGQANHTLYISQYLCCRPFIYSVRSVRLFYSAAIDLWPVRSAFVKFLCNTYIQLAAVNTANFESLPCLMPARHSLHFGNFRVANLSLVEQEVYPKYRFVCKKYSNQVNGEEQSQQAKTVTLFVAFAFSHYFTMSAKCRKIFTDFIWVVIQ